MKKILSVILFTFYFSELIAAEPDSLIFTNDNYVVGEVKSMQRGVLIMETPFSDKDFAIELDGIKEIYCKTYFLITLTDGSRHYGNIGTEEPGKVKIITDDGQEIVVMLDDIVILNDIDQSFASRFYASIDIGFDMTKANNFRQISIRSTAGYHAKHWNLNGTYNTLKSSQDNVEDIERTDAKVGYKFYLPKDWYLVSSLNFLSNTEQRLDLRSTLNIGVGKYLVHTNRKYWSFGAGFNLNKESFSGDAADKNSIEGFLGSELNLFDIGDVDLFTTLLVYPSLTETNRWRTDFNIDTKYDLPLIDDFYIKIGFTLNYDNQPVEGAADTDYIFHTGFGWEW
jgi:putative salt-induced outer membrane protein YdiY